MVMRKWERLLGQRVPHDCHATLPRSGATGSGFGIVVLGIVTVLVLLVLMVSEGLHVLYGELWCGVRCGQAGQLAVTLRERLNGG